MKVALSVLVLWLVPALAVAGFSETICLAPTNFNPNVGLFPTEESIQIDLQVLYNEGFRGIVTYASDGTLDSIPWIARQIGFEWVVMGIWCPTNSQEVADAIAQAPYVDAYCIGNEGLPNGYYYCQYDTTSLAACMAYVKVQTGKLVTTAEQIDKYLPGNVLSGWLLRHGDFLFPNVHPYWNNQTEPIPAVNWVVTKYNELAALTSKPVYFKESGLPSAGCSTCSEINQMDFWVLLSATDVDYCHFESYDQYWKGPDLVEPHWGFNDRYRNPKLVALWHQDTGIDGQPSWGTIKAMYR